MSTLPNYKVFFLYSQLISIPTFSRVIYKYGKDYPTNYYNTPVKLLGTLFGIWNLDFFLPYYQGYYLRTGSLATLSLEFAIAGSLFY